MIQIKVVDTDTAEHFAQAVNALLAEGWELYGPPSMQMVSYNDTWDDRLRGHVESSFRQVLKKDLEPPRR